MFSGVKTKTMISLKSPKIEKINVCWFERTEGLGAAEGGFWLKGENLNKKTN